VDALLEYIERYKFAIFGTVIFHVLVFFYFNFKTIEEPFRMPDPEISLSIPLDDIEFDPEIMKMMNLDKQQPSEEVYNLAADQNDTREKSYDDYSTQEIDDQVEFDAKKLEQQYFDEWAATHDNGDNGSTADIELDKDKNKSNEINKSNIKTDGSNAFAGSVMVSFNLKDRKAHSLPKPGYTCNSSGTVVIDIKVDKNGGMRTATYNPSKSQGADECMISKALKYARKSRFNLSNSAPSTQSGSITYKFVSK